MKHHDLTNRPDKLTLRLTPDAHTVAVAMIHDFHANVAEYTLRTRGILPELKAYIVGIGRQAR